MEGIVNVSTGIERELKRYLNISILESVIIIEKYAAMN